MNPVHEMARALHFRSAVALVGTFPVLAGVDLDLDAGEIVALAGPNGAGKTSILRAAAGLLRVTSGEAQVLGVDLLEDRRSARWRIGLLGHDGGLYDDLTAEGNVGFALRAARCGGINAAAALERVGLTGRVITTAAGSLSAGQRRRVALAILVARQPELWLLDEPHAGLDAASRDFLDGIIRDAAAAGSTVLFASHEVERARSLAGRLVTVAGGVVVPGPPALRKVEVAGVA
ncbi:MAG: heme ABC exporter ATP-binding protein CcmA [Acidimicrobiales bacterium]